MVYLTSIELVINILFGEAAYHILPMVISLAGNVFDQAAYIKNIIHLFFRHECVHSSRMLGSAEHWQCEN